MPGSLWCLLPFHDPEAIHILEARVMNQGLVYAGEVANVRDCRRGMLGDNVSDILAFEPSRAHNFKLLVQI